MVVKVGVCAFFSSAECPIAITWRRQLTRGGNHAVVLRGDFLRVTGHFRDLDEQLCPGGRRAELGREQRRDVRCSAGDSGDRPSVRHLSHTEMPADCGGQALTSALAGMVPAVLSLMLTTPPLLVMLSVIGGTPTGITAAGGLLTVAWPVRIATVLTWMNSCSPVIRPDWPSSGLVCCAPAAVFHAAICACVSVRQVFAWRLSACRTASCAAVRGFVGMARMRETWPYRPPWPTTTPRLPVLGTSNTFICLSV